MRIWLFGWVGTWPLWCLRALGQVLGCLVWLGSAAYRQRLRQNMAYAGCSGWRLEVQAIAQAGKMVAELPRLWLGKCPPIVWHGLHHIEQAHAQGLGVVFLTPHMGSFEAAARGYVERFARPHEQEGGREFTVLFRPARQAWLRNLMLKARSRPGLTTAPTTVAGVRQLMRTLKNGGTVGLLPDQVPPHGQGVWTPFFGQDAYTMTLAARLGQMPNVQTLLAWGERLPCGQGYAIHVQPMAQPVDASLPEAVRQINQALEGLILSHPSQYLWGYARYKPPTIPPTQAAAAPSV